jgi:hypothetical protein
MLQTLDSTTEGKNTDSAARHKQAGSDIQLNALQCLVATPTKITTHTTVHTTTPLEHTHTKHNTNDALQNRRGDHNEAAMFATRITIIEIPTQKKNKKNKKNKKKPTLQQQMKEAEQKHTHTHTHTRNKRDTLLQREHRLCKTRATSSRR